MHKLTQFRLCPRSRAIRLALAELGMDVELADEPAWEWRKELLALNPSGELPVLELDDGPILCGCYAISEFLDEMSLEHLHEARPLLLFPGNRESRAEVRRLVDWFLGKMHREVTDELLHEKVYARVRPGAVHAPNSDNLHAARANLRYHLSYVGYLAHQRRWLAGEEMSFADLTAAAHLSIVDYLGEVRWDDHPAAKLWYGRIKSRRAFRSLLSDRVPGTPAARHYVDLDF